MRFFTVDGLEIDVQDPKFFVDESLWLDIQQAIMEMLHG